MGLTVPRGKPCSHVKNQTTMQFGIGVSASQVEIGDYGTASGYVKLNGTGLAPQQMTLTGEINELALDGYDFPSHKQPTAPIHI